MRELMPGELQCLPSGKYFGVSRVSRRIGDVTLAESAYRQGTSLPEHAHEEHHFVLVLAGHYEETVDGRNAARKPAQLLFLPRDVPHSERHLSFGRHFMIEPPAGWFERFASAHANLTRDSQVAHDEGAKLAMRVGAR